MDAFKASAMVLALSMSGAASATTINFGCISNNDLANCAIGESQISVELTAYGTDQVLFTFMNVGSEDSSITEVYFDDGTLLGLSALIDADENSGDAGVDFTSIEFGKVSPAELPGANTINPVFETSAGFLADADNPGPKKGVNPGESLGVIFDLLPGISYTDTVAALGTELRLGIHVISMGDSGDSESFISTTSAVPVPAAVWLFGSGLVGLAGIARRQS